MGTRYNCDQVVKAVHKCHGIHTAVAKALKVNWTTVMTYRKRWKSVEQAFQQAEDRLLDEAESVLYKKAVTEEDTTSLIFLLKTKGRDRGYASAPAVSVSTTVAVATPVHTFTDKDKMKIAKYLKSVGALDSAPKELDAGGKDG